MGWHREQAWSLLRLKVPGFESHTDILSRSFLSFFMLFLLLLRDNGHCWWKSWSVITSSVIDHSHTWAENIPFYGCQRFFFLGLLVSSWDKIAVSNCPSLLYERRMTKQTKWHVRPVKTQISRGIRPVWSKSSLSAWRKLGSLASISNLFIPQII